MCNNSMDYSAKHFASTVRYSRGSIWKYVNTDLKKADYERGIRDFVSSRPVIIVGTENLLYNNCIQVICTTTSENRPGFVYYGEDFNDPTVIKKGIITPYMVMTISKASLTRYMGQLDPALFDRCVNAMLYHLGLSHDTPEYVKAGTEEYIEYRNPITVEYGKQDRIQPPKEHTIFSTEITAHPASIKSKEREIQEIIDRHNNSSRSKTKLTIEDAYAIATMKSPDVAEKLGVPVQMIYTWKKKLAINIAECEDDLLRRLENGTTQIKFLEGFDRIIFAHMTEDKLVNSQLVSQGSKKELIKRYLSFYRSQTEYSAEIAPA